MWCFHFIKLIALLFFSPQEKPSRPRVKTIKPTTMTMTFLIFSLTCLIAGVLGQSNYAQHGHNINYIGTGLPEETLLDGKVSRQFFCFFTLCVGDANSTFDPLWLTHFTPFTLFLGNETRWLKPDYFLKSNEGRTQLRRWLHGGEFLVFSIRANSRNMCREVISKGSQLQHSWVMCSMFMKDRRGDWLPVDSFRLSLFARFAALKIKN